MKAFWLFSGIGMLLSSCSYDKPPTGFYNKEIELSNYEQEGILCKLSIHIPSRYDTLLDWIDQSDCGCCGSKKYRLLNKSSCLIKESGFFYPKVCRDTFDRLSIAYQCKVETDLSQEVNNIILNIFADNLEGKIKSVWSNETLKWKAKKIIHIKNEPYLFLHFISKNIHSQIPVEQIYAGTFFDNTLILFIFENSGKAHPNFVKEAYTSIQSIKLRPI